MRCSQEKVKLSMQRSVVAARDLKRRYIGIELDRNHAQTAADRAYERTAQTYSERL